MKYEDLIKKLENIKTPEIEIQSHQRRLRLALLNSGYWKDKKAMSLLKKFAPIFAPVGALAVIALLVVVGIGYFKNPSSVSQNNLLAPQAVYAKELVGLAQEQLAKTKAVAAIPDPFTGFVKWKTPDADGNIRDEKGNIIYITTPEGGLMPAPREMPSSKAYVISKGDYMSFLEEAKKAADLIYLGDKILSENKRVRVLRFTDEKGSISILGIDENNYPVVRLAYTKTGEGIGGVMFGSGPINGQTPSRLNLEEAVKYWTENLEQPTDFKAIQK